MVKSKWYGAQRQHKRRGEWLTHYNIQANKLTDRNDEETVLLLHNWFQMFLTLFLYKINKHFDGDLYILYT